MDKKNPFFTASMASVMYFIIFVMLKYFLQQRTLDIKGALIGMVAFWIVIFFVHHYLKKRYSNNDE